MTSEFKILPIGDVYPDPDQPRKSGMADQDLVDMAESLSSLGILHNLRVTPDGKGKYKIVTGERRFRAALKAGLMDIPTFIDNDLTESKRVEIQLAENLLRRDLSIRERADAIARVTKISGDHQAAAKRLGISKGHLSNLLELNELSPEIEALSSAKITRDATTLVLANRLMKKAPEVAREILATANETGKLPRKVITAALTPHRRQKKKKDDEGSNSIPDPKSTPLSFASISQSLQDDRPAVVRSPHRTKLAKVCVALNLDSATDPAVIFEQLVDRFLATDSLVKNAAGNSPDL